MAAWIINVQDCDTPLECMLTQRLEKGLCSAYTVLIIPLSLFLQGNSFHTKINSAHNNSVSSDRYFLVPNISASVATQVKQVKLCAAHPPWLWRPDWLKAGWFTSRWQPHVQSPLHAYLHTGSHAYTKELLTPGPCPSYLLAQPSS